MKTVLKVRQEIAHYCIEERKDRSSLSFLSLTIQTSKIELLVFQHKATGPKE